MPVPVFTVRNPRELVELDYSTLSTPEEQAQLLTYMEAVQSQETLQGVLGPCIVRSVDVQGDYMRGGWSAHVVLQYLAPSV